MDEELKKQSREELQKLPVEEQETLAVEYLKKTIGNMVSAGFTPMVKQKKGHDMKDEKTKLPLSDDEIDRLMLSMASRDDGATEKEIEDCVRWAQIVRLEAGILELILEGEVEIRFNEARVPVFFPTLKGSDRLK